MAMEESALALSKHYVVPFESITLHINDLLYRFTNAALKDTCKRVGGDPARKLSPHDRLIGSSSLVLENGDVPAYITIGAAAGLKRFVDEQGLAQNAVNAAKLLHDNAGLEEDSVLFKLIMDMYDMIISGATIGQLRRAADKLKAANRSNVI
jgi:mannitol-1-phosphate 5-dehydrogenase